MYQLIRINLRAFDGEASTEGGNPANAQPEQSEIAPDAQAQNENAPETTARPTFDELVKGEYKKDFDERVQQIVGRRLKHANTALDASRPILAALQQRYGIEDGDGVEQRIMQALEADDAYWRSAADDAGMTVDQYKRISKAERESAELRSRLDAQQTEANRRMMYQVLNDQAEQVRAKYPSFDVAAELRGNQQFGALVKAGIDMLTAYQVTHQDEIIGAAVQEAERRAEEKTVEKVRQNQSRPVENGSSGAKPASFTGDVRQMSKADFEALMNRVMRGERITPC